MAVTPLFAAAANLASRTDPVSVVQPSWLKVGTTFAPATPHLAQFTARPVSPDSVASHDDPSPSIVESDRDSDREDGPGVAEPPPDAAKEERSQPQTLFTTDRRGDHEQGRFGRMYAGDAPVYFPPPAGLRSRPLGFSRLAAHRGHPGRLVPVREGVGSGVVRPALSARDAAAARAAGGAWAQVAAEAAAAARQVTAARSGIHGAGGRYFHAAAAEALGSANRHAAAALGGAAGAHLSEAAERLDSLRRGTTRGHAAAATGEEEEEEEGGSANARLARLIAEGYAKQGLAGGVSVASGGAGSLRAVEAGAPPPPASGGRRGGGGGSSGGGFLPLMPSTSVDAGVGGITTTSASLMRLTNSASATARNDDEVVSASRAAWESESGYAARRLRQLHTLAQLFPRDQRVWRALAHATLALQPTTAPANSVDVDGKTGFAHRGKPSHQRSQRQHRVALEATLAVVDAAIVAALPSGGAPPQLVLDRLSLLNALHPGDPQLVDGAWRDVLTLCPGPSQRPYAAVQPRLWAEYLLWFRGCFALFSVAEFRRRFREALATVVGARDEALAALSAGAVTVLDAGSGTIAARLRSCDFAVLDILTVAAATEAAAGFLERGVALWQAAYEFNCGRPLLDERLPGAVKLRFFDAYWDSEHPRLGDTHPSAAAAAVADTGAENQRDALRPSKPEGGDPSSVYFVEVVSSGWHAWHQQLIAGLSPTDLAAAGLFAAGARKKRFQVDGPASAGATAELPQQQPLTLQLTGASATLCALAEAFSAGEKLGLAQLRGDRVSAQAAPMSSSGAVPVSKHAVLSTPQVPQLIPLSESSWGAFGVSELRLEASFAARDAAAAVAAAAAAEAAAAAAAAALLPPPVNEVASARAAERAAAKARRFEALVACGADPRFLDSSDDENVGTGSGQRSDDAGAALAAALVRKAASNAASAAAPVPDGYVSYYSSLHGYRIAVPAAAVGGVAADGLEFREASGASDVYRRVLLEAAADRARGASAAAGAGSSGAQQPGVTTKAAELLLPSPEPAQLEEEHPLTQWLVACEACLDGHGHDTVAAPLRLIEVDTRAYTPPTAASRETPAVLQTGWVSVDQGSCAADSDSPASACALAAATRLLSNPSSWVGSRHARVGAVKIGVSLHTELYHRFLAFLGVRVRFASGSSRSTLHALSRATSAGAAQPGGGAGAGAVVWQLLGGGSPAAYYGQVADVSHSLAAAPAAAGVARRVLHRALAQAHAASASLLPGAPGAALPPSSVRVLRAALIDLEAARAVAAARAGVPKAYEVARKAVRALLSLGSLSETGSIETGVDEWLAYARFEAACGRQERAHAVFTALLARVPAASAAAGSTGCGPAVVLVALESAALLSSSSLSPASGAGGDASHAALVSLALALSPAAGDAGASTPPFTRPPHELLAPRVVSVARAALRSALSTAMRGHIEAVEAVCAKWSASVEQKRQSADSRGVSSHCSLADIDALFVLAVTDVAAAAGTVNAQGPAVRSRRSRWDAIVPLAAASPEDCGAAALAAAHPDLCDFARCVLSRLGLEPPSHPPRPTGSEGSLPPSSTVIPIAPLLASAALFAYAFGSGAQAGDAAPLDAAGAADVAAATAQFHRGCILLLALVRTLAVTRLRIDGAYDAAGSSAPGCHDEDAAAEVEAQMEEDVRGFVPALERWLAAAASPAASRLSARLAHLSPVLFASGRTSAAQGEAAGASTAPGAPSGSGGGLSTAELRGAVLGSTGGVSTGFPDPLWPLDAGLADTSTAVGTAIDALLGALEWLVERHVCLLQAHAAAHRSAPPRLLRQALQLAVTVFPGNLGLAASHLLGRSVLVEGWGPAAVTAQLAGAGGGWGSLTTHAHAHGLRCQWGVDAPPELRVAELLVALSRLAGVLSARVAQAASGAFGSAGEPASAGADDTAAAVAAVKRLCAGALWAAELLDRAAVPSAACTSMPVLWRAALRVLLQSGDAGGAARLAFLRGVHAAPWSRALWLDLLARLRPYVDAGAAGRLLAFAHGAKGLAVAPPAAATRAVALATVAGRLMA